MGYDTKESNNRKNETKKKAKKAIIIIRLYLGTNQATVAPVDPVSLVNLVTAMATSGQCTKSSCSKEVSTTCLLL